MARGILLSLLMLSSFSSAKERELGVHGGKPAYIRVRGVAEKGIKLQPGVAGWYLTVDVPGSGLTSPPTPTRSRSSAACAR